MDAVGVTTSLVISCKTSTRGKFKSSVDLLLVATVLVIRADDERECVNAP